jgi:hypothetical protein
MGSIDSAVKCVIHRGLPEAVSGGGVGGNAKAAMYAVIPAGRYSVVVANGALKIR